MKRPLVLLILCFCSGIACANLIRINFYLIYASLILFLIAASLMFKKQRVFNILLLILMFLMGFLALKNARIFPANHISNYVFKSDSPYTLKGIVSSEPQLKGEKISFILKAEEIHIGRLNRECSGNVIVHLRGKSRISYGEEILLYGNLHRPYFFRQGGLFIMEVKNDSGILKLNRNKGFFIKRFALRLKAKIKDSISKRTSALTASILEAMILGEKRDIPWFVSEWMMKTGTIHILPRLYTKMPSVAL